MSTVACYPVLSSTISYLTQKSDIGAAITQFVILNPGRTSDHVEELLVSFRKLASEFGHDPSRICSELQTRVQESMMRYFPNDKVVAEFTSSSYDTDRPEDPRYRVNFNVYFVNEDGSITPSVVAGYFNVKEDYEIELSFK